MLSGMCRARGKLAGDLKRFRGWKWSQLREVGFTHQFTSRYKVCRTKLSVAIIERNAA